MLLRAESHGASTAGVARGATLGAMEPLPQRDRPVGGHIELPTARTKLRRSVLKVLYNRFRRGFEALSGLRMVLEALE